MEQLAVGDAKSLRDPAESGSDWLPNVQLRSELNPDQPNPTLFKNSIKIDPLRSYVGAAPFTNIEVDKRHEL